MNTTLLVMAKDAAAHLERCLASCDELVDDMLVLDTGSTDDTIEVAESWGATVVERPWKGWSGSRNELLRVGTISWPSTRFLLLDADMTVEGELPGPAEPGLLEVDCWNAWFVHDNLRYRKPFLVNAEKPWEYRGATHEALYCDEPFRGRDTDLFTVTHHGRSGGHLAGDKEALEAAGAADTRNLFYLAQTYKDLGDWQSAIACYKARAELGGYEEERYYALYQAGCLACAHRSFDEGQELLMRAWRLRPTRAESLRAMAFCAMNVADQIPFPESDSLFIEPGAYASGDADPVDR